jgi:GNAT superfamily N-acetyltransferase
MPSNSRIVIRRADLTADREVLLDTLALYLNPRADARRFDWLYKDNPHGQAYVWLAIDTDSGMTVGSAAAFPRYLYTGAEKQLGWVLGDFCVNDQYRSLGPALQLQRACLAAVDSGSATFCYDFPSAGMMAVYKRLGIRPFASEFRLARPLRVDRKIRATVKSRIVAAGLTASGNFLLALGTGRSLKRGDLNVSFQQGKCGEEFSALAGEIAGRYGVCVHRSAEYLNWRYLANTYCHHELMTVRRNGKLLAYAVIGQVEDDGIIADLFGFDDAKIIRRLVEDVVALFRVRGVFTVNLPVLENHPWLRLLRSLGFKIREEKPMVVYTPKAEFKHDPLEGMNWFFMHGDRDS